MKSVQLSADLPPADSHIMLTYNSLPVRPHHRAVPRNKTGIYMGSDAPPNSPRTYHSVPPLAKPRGTLFRPRTPTEKRRRQQRVEALRIREEPRGFHPQPVRKAKPKVKQEETQSLPGNTNSDQAPVLRKSARNFVAAANSGVTHLEDLGLEELSLRSVSAGRESSIPPSIVEDIQNANKRMVGLQECYSKICKGNLTSLQSLLPARKAAGGRARTIATPLTIRSFRNPRSPHSVVQYSDLKHKSMNLAASAKPLVPAPYYYSSKGLPNATDDGGSKVRLTRLPASSRSTERVLAAPGVGAISQSALHRHAASLPSDPPRGIEGMPPPSRSSNAKFMDSEDHYAHKDGFRVPSGTPAVSTTDLHNISSPPSVSEHQTDGHKASIPRDPRHSTKSEAQPAAPPASPASTRKLRTTRVPTNQNNSHSIPTGLANGGSPGESTSNVEDPSSAVIQEDPSSTLAEKNPSSTLAEEDPSSTLAEKDPSSTLAEEDPSSTLAEKDPSSTLTQEDLSSTLTQEDPSSALTQEDPSSALTQEDPSSALTQEDPSSTLTQEDHSSALTQEDPSSALTQEDPSSTLTHDDLSSTLTQEDPSSTLTQEDPSSTLTQEDPSSTLTQEDPSSTLTQEDPSSTLIQEDRVPPAAAAVAIVVSVEDDSGHSHMVDLEEELEAEYEGGSKDAVPHGDSEQVVQEWQEASEKKQAELQRLLEEHQEIVSRIEELEKMQGQGGCDVPPGQVKEEEE